MRLRNLLLYSDPPTASDGSAISYQKEEVSKPSYTEDDKVAVFFFPNNSIVPDKQAENVIKEIVKFYSESSLILVGHASSLGGDNPEGKKINMQLSFARAEAIKNMLINKGFPLDNITVLGKGDLEPTLKSTSNKSDSDDRRVEVFLFSK
jgi:outer membrane protein OmpA-like peptidoglycan-associated protein